MTLSKEFYEIIAELDEAERFWHFLPDDNEKIIKLRSIAEANTVNSLAGVKPKGVAAVNSDGICMKWADVKEAAKSIGTTERAIRLVCRGERRDIKGFVLEYIENPTNV